MDILKVKQEVLAAAFGICALEERELLERLERLYLTGFKAGMGEAAGGGGSVKSITPKPELTEPQAYALAELCKRITFAECRNNAVDDAEAYLMIEATDKMRAWLAETGIRVR